MLSGKLAHRTTACLVGCGLGTSGEAQKLVEYLLARSKAPMVIDADGLNAIAAEPEMLSKAQAPLVLTPHPGEMARLLKTTVQDVQRRRLEYAKQFAVKHRAVLVLKGNKTVVACPDGGSLSIPPETPVWRKPEAATCWRESLVPFWPRGWRRNKRRRRCLPSRPGRRPLCRALVSDRHDGAGSN